MSEHDPSPAGFDDSAARDSAADRSGERTSEASTGPISGIRPVGGVGWQARPSGALSAPHGMSGPLSGPLPYPESQPHPESQRYAGPSPAGPSAYAAEPHPWAPSPADPWSRPGEYSSASAWSAASPMDPPVTRLGAPAPAWTRQWSGSQVHPMTAGAIGARSSTDQPGQGAPATLTAPAPHRGRRWMTTAAVAALVLAAGFGGGVVGGMVQDNGSQSAAADSSLSQQTPSAPASDRATQTAPTGSVQAVAAKVLPSVVSILAVSNSQKDEGSGVILTPTGLILTNNHVIAGASELTVQFNDGTSAKATVVGADATDDLAVIQAQGVSGLHPVTLGRSADLQVGQSVVAVGSPLGLSATVTSGIVSALNRPVRTASDQQAPGGPDQTQGQTKDTVLNAIQTDAPINPGNSGGPLVDMNGEVIGINSAIATLSTGGSGQAGSIGVGFAIPIDQAHRIAQELINTGKASHAVLGASVGDAVASGSGLTTGALIASVASGSGAEKAGLAKGDVVTKVGDQLIESADALVATIRSSTPGGAVQITYQRDSQTHTVSVTLGSAAN